MDMEQRLRLEQLQATEREVIGKVIHNDNPKVISIHIDLQNPRLDFKYMKIIWLPTAIQLVSSIYVYKILLDTSNINGMNVLICVLSKSYVIVCNHQDDGIRENNKTDNILLQSNSGSHMIIHRNM